MMIMLKSLSYQRAFLAERLKPLKPLRDLAIDLATEVIAHGLSRLHARKLQSLRCELSRMHEKAERLEGENRDLKSEVGDLRLSLHQFQRIAFEALDDVEKHEARQIDPDKMC